MQAIEYADVEIKLEELTEPDCDQSYIPESPAFCEDNIQEQPSTSTSIGIVGCVGATGTSNVFTQSSGGEYPLQKRKRNEIDVSRLISVKNLERSSTTAINDTHFCNSVAFEIEGMDEDSRDLTKAAIWQVIYKVKSAKKRNIELTLDDIFK